MSMNLIFSTLGCPGASLDTIVTLAQRFDCPAVELRIGPAEVCDIGSPVAEVQRVADALQRSGVGVEAVCSYVKLAAGSDDQLVIRQLHDHLELAGRLGASGLRIFPGAEIETGAAPSESVNESMVRRLLESVEVAAKNGVRMLLETHDSHPVGRQVAAVLNAVADCGGGPWVGVIWDAVHPWRAGEAPVDTLAAVGDFLLSGRGYVQLKDARSAADPTPVLTGHGAAPLPLIVESLLDRGYAGPWSLEWERAWHPDIPPLETAMAETVRWFGQLLSARSA